MSQTTQTKRQAKRRNTPRKPAGRAASGPITLRSTSDDLRAVRASLGVNQQLMHRLTGLSVRTLSSLETGGKNPNQDDVRRYQELARLRRELAYLVEPQAIAPWLQTPNEALGGASPLELIERGESDRLWRLIWRLQDGVPLD
ncbi:MAG: DUF2384 domain-containing protein [Sumerlaeia bacterium]